MLTATQEPVPSTRDQTAVLPGLGLPLQHRQRHAQPCAAARAIERVRWALAVRGHGERPDASDVALCIRGTSAMAQIGGALVDDDALARREPVHFEPHTVTGVDDVARGGGPGMQWHDVQALPDSLLAPLTDDGEAHIAGACMVRHRIGAMD